MKPHVRHYRAIVLVTSSLRLRAPFVIVCLLILTMLYQPASAQQSDAGAVANPAPLTAEQVVHNLALMNLHRAQALHPYQETRTYRVQYHGFPGTRDAEMVVIVITCHPARKNSSFNRPTGSKLIVDKVLKKLLEAEKEESHPGGTALRADRSKLPFLTDQIRKHTLRLRVRAERQTTEKGHVSLSRSNLG